MVRNTIENIHKSMDSRTDEALKKRGSTSVFVQVRQETAKAPWLVGSSFLCLRLGAVGR